MIDERTAPRRQPRQPTPPYPVSPYGSPPDWWRQIHRSYRRIDDPSQAAPDSTVGALHRQIRTAADRPTTEPHLVAIRELQRRVESAQQYVAGVGPDADPERLATAYATLRFWEERGGDYAATLAAARNHMLLLMSDMEKQWQRYRDLRSLLDSARNDNGFPAVESELRGMAREAADLVGRPAD